MLKIKEEPVEIEEWDDTTHSAIPLYDVDTDVKVEKLDSSYLNNEIYQESSCHNDETSEKLHQVEQIEIVAPSVPIQQDISVLHGTHHGTSSLPATQTWPGEYGFTVSFNPQNKNTKGISWTYSKIKDKLYVGKDVPCPINFSANTIVPNDVYVRVMALYTSPGQVFENVRRCVNHSMEEIQNGVTEAEHLIRCDSTRASYEVDATTGHLSVRVPFENPAAGQPFSTYIYKFACFGSCAGGPNRRPLILVFTLEKENKVLGRRKLDVKICACPGRDRKAEEAQCIVEENSQGSILKQKDQEEFVNLSDAFSFTKSVNCLPARKSYKLLPNKDGCYIIPAGNKECYEFLLQMKKLYEICSSMSGLSPDIMKALRHYHKRKLYEKI